MKLARKGDDRMAAARDCALGAAVLGAQAGYHAIGGPWWAGFLLAALGFLVSFLVACLRIVFPQDSPDKLAMWRAFLALCRRIFGRRDSGGAGVSGAGDKRT
jgi:hypothetical protein